MILADHVGLNIMASACFDPKEAVGVWKRMDEHERSSRIARMATEFLQTHPTHGSRIEKVSPFHGELWTMRTGELTHYSGIRSFLGSLKLRAIEIGTAASLQEPSISLSIGILEIIRKVPTSHHSHNIAIFSL
jgi:hypothetical protein